MDVTEGEEILSKTLEPLVELFSISKKRDIERHCRSLIVYSSDLVLLIWAGRAGELAPYKYACRFNDKIPTHLKPTEEEYEALGRAKVGERLGGKAQKFFRKMTQTVEERRLFSAHLFYTPTQGNWHLFYFDQRDREGDRNHWRHGSHIHYVNDMFHREPLEGIWKRVLSGEPGSLKGLHLRYVEARQKS